ncbi:EamA family transporter [Candidatus Roizmanbacteria bacterium]|nr:EamA family transporter [Candidatus Roizmanbacteria bacterium]
MWLFFTLLSAIFFGVGQVFIKRGLKETTPLFNNILTTIFGFSLMVPFSLSQGVHFDRILQIAPLTTIAALLFLSYYYLIGKGQVSFTGTVIGTYPILTVILSLLFLHENPNLFQKLAIILVVFGTAFIAMPSRLKEFKKIQIGNWFWWAICGIFTIGTADFLIKLLMNQSDLYTYLFTYAFCSMFITGLSFLIDKQGRKLPPLILKNYLPTLIGAILMELGFFVFHIALSGGLVSLVSPIGSIYVAITAVLAWLFLKEKINIIHFVGIALATVGVILVGIV